MHQINKSLWPNCTAVLFSKVDNWAPGLKLPWTMDTPFSRLHLHHLCYPYKDKSSFIIFGQTIIIYKRQWQCDTVQTMIWYWFDFSPPALLFQHDQPRRLPQRGESGSPRGDLDFSLDFSRFWNGFLILQLWVDFWFSFYSFWTLQVGPYIYEEKWDKVEVDWRNDTVTYRLRKFYKY